MLDPVPFDPSRHRLENNCLWLQGLRSKLGRSDLLLYEHMGPPVAVVGNYVLFTLQDGVFMNEMCAFPCHPDDMLSGGAMDPLNTRMEPVTEDLIRGALRPGLEINERKVELAREDEREFRTSQHEEATAIRRRAEEITRDRIVVGWTKEGGPR